MNCIQPTEAACALLSRTEQKGPVSSLNGVKWGLAHCIFSQRDI